MRYPKRFLAGVLLCAGLLLLFGCKGATRKPVPTRATAETAERQFATPAEGDFIAIFTTSLGEIRAVLYPDAAPMAVYNFVGLARSGYYDNTTIWRAEYGFAVQGGDATGTGTGGSTIWSNEPYPLEATTGLRHYAGALCTALAPGDTASGNSQFYFVTALPTSVDTALQEQLRASGYTEEQIAAYAAAGGLPYLDNTDTVFGQIYEGMAVADKMAAVDTQQDEEGNDTFRPTEEAAITIQKVTIANYPGPTTEELAASGAAADPASSAAAG
ncbi:MAG: peptidylprolyl isomerase [Gemmiger sp.]|nr:peptidylprolyl isomerase [Gemmiger sp.]